MADYDVIIIGGNTHGLTQAAYLAKSGQKCLVLEKAPILGGSAITEEMSVPGFKFNPAATGECCVHPMLNEELHLTDQFGLETIKCPVTLTTLFGDGEYMSIYPEPEKTRDEIARFSKKDADIYLQFYKEWLTLGQMFSMYTTNEAVSWGKIAQAMCTSEDGERMFRNMCFASTMDVLDNYFESDYVKSAFLPLHEGNWQPPSAGVFFFNIARAFAPWGIIRGGIANVINALARCCEHYGVDIQKNTTVTKVLTKDEVAYGVELSDGRKIMADTIIGNIEPNATFDTFLKDERENMPADFKRGLREMKYEGQGMTINIALNDVPDFGIPKDRLLGFIGFCKPGYDMYQFAYANFFKRQLPDLIPNIGFLPTVMEGESCTLAPKGKHIHTLMANPLPFDLETPWDKGGKEMAIERTIDTINTFAPGYKDLVIGADGFSPLELEQKLGFKKGGEGHNRQVGWYNSMNQRPFIGYADYHTPIKGYYMAGCTAHPVHGIGGIGGRLVAKKILKDKGIPFSDAEWRGDYVGA